MSAVALTTAFAAPPHPGRYRELSFAVNEKAAEKKVATALAIQIFNNVGIKLIVTPMPGDKANKLALDGEVDGEVARITAYTTSNPTLTRVDPSFYGFVSAAFTKKGTSIAVNNKEDLKKYTVGYVRGIAHAQKITENVKNVIVADNYDHLFKLLATEKIQVAIDSKINGQDQINKFGLTALIEPAKSLAVFDEHFIFARHKELAQLIGDEVKRLKESGELGLMAKKYEKIYFPQE